MKEIIKLNVNDLVVNKNNYRHYSVDDELSAIQLLSGANEKSANKMLSLCKSFINNGYFSDSVFLVSKIENSNKYIVLDGNRRLTAIKIIDNPSLIKLNGFTESLYRFVSSHRDASILNGKVNCIVYNNPRDANARIKQLHADGDDQLIWGWIEQAQFDLDNGIEPKLWYSIIEKNCPDQLNHLQNPSTLHRLLTKENVNTFFPVDKEMKFLNEKSVDHLKLIISDITEQKQTSTTLRTAIQREKYLKRVTEFQNKSEKLITSTEVDYNDIDVSSSLTKTISRLEGNNKNKSNSKAENPTTMEKNRPQKPITVDPYQIKNISITNPNIQQKGNEIGIYHLLRELTDLGTNKRKGMFDYENYKLSTTFLIRSLFEQTLIHWMKENFPRKYNTISQNKNPELSVIINSLGRMIDDGTVVFDDKVDRIFKSAIVTKKDQDYLNLLIHHPYLFNNSTSELEPYISGSIVEIIKFVLEHQ